MRLSRDLLVGLVLLLAMPAWAQVGIPTPIATTGIAGKVKPDGTSISVAADGTISTLGAPPSGAAGGILAGTFPNPGASATALGVIATAAPGCNDVTKVVSGTGTCVAVSSYSQPTLGSTAIPSGATVTAITGLASLGITAPAVNATPLTISGYSLTGSDTHALASYSGTLNTSGVVNVLDYQFTVTAVDGASLVERIRGGASGTTLLRSLDKDGNITIGANMTISAAGEYLFGTTRGGIEAPADASFGFFNHTGAAEAYLSVLGNGSFGIGASASGTNGTLAYTHPYTYSQPISTGTVTMTTPQVTAFEYAIIDPAGTLAVLTVTLPTCDASADSHIAAFSSTQIVTSLTVNAAGGTVADAPGSLAVGGGNSYICRATGTKWFRLS